VVAHGRHLLQHALVQARLLLPLVSALALLLGPVAAGGTALAFLPARSHGLATLGLHLQETCITTFTEMRRTSTKAYL
jgi:hypothetical protein